MERTSPEVSMELSPKVKDLLQQEFEYSVGGFDPMPSVFERAEGCKLWDVDGKEYLDFVSMFSCVNTGHGHPAILEAVIKQMRAGATINLASHNAMWPPFAKMMCERFGYDKIAAVVTGSEAVDTACKIARKWGIQKKKIPAEKCLILGTGDNYHGLTSGIWNLMQPSAKRTGYGLDSLLQMNVNPSTGELLAYGDIKPMERCIAEHHSRIAAVIMEPIRGHLSSFAQEIEYARGVYDLCKKHNILFIADEVRMGGGKTGKWLSHQHCGPDVKPDIVTMGKSISGGLYPTSYVLGSNEVMELVGRFEVASTYAFTPTSIAAVVATLKVFDSEGLVERAAHLGDLYLQTVSKWHSPLVRFVTACGADMGIELKADCGVTPRKIAALCMYKGLHVFPSVTRIRMSVPMVITDEEFLRGLSIMKEALDEVQNHKSIKGEFWEGRN